MSTRPHAFNYQLQRFMIGFAAGLLPLLVGIFGCDDLTSISASYHSSARNIFVACLSAVGGLMIPYQGKDASEKEEFWLSKLGGIAAVVTAFVPTACPGKDDPTFTCLVDSACGSANEAVHIGAALLVFGVLTRLCWLFAKRAARKKSLEGPKALLRARIYTACIVANALGAVIIILDKAGIDLGDAAMFLGEAIMLAAFSIAWLTASQLFLVGAGERPELLPSKPWPR